MESKFSNRVREYARCQYIEPARQRNQLKVTIVAGDVEKAVGLKSRAPLVCQALGGRKFLQENHLVLEKKEGPRSGLSTTVAFTYRLDAENSPSTAASRVSFVTLRGIGKEVFQSLGGGEAFIRQERASFYGDGKDQ